MYRDLTGGCVLDVIGVSSIFRLARKVTTLTWVFPTFVLICEDRDPWREWKSGRVHGSITEVELLKL